MSKIAITVPPRSGSLLPTSVMQSTFPRRVHTLKIRRELGGRPISTSICRRIPPYASSTNRLSPAIPGMKNGANVCLEPALASVFAQRLVERAGLNPRFELGDSLALSQGFTVDRVLKPL